jgi:predicted RNA-binding Zn-ribbon protein involved in translation (DUF1610 family)
MKFRYDTYCGLYCGACAILLANERDEVEKKAKEWKMKPEELKCHGCKTETIASFCVTRDIRKCAEKKKIHFCFQCEEYPCDLLVGFKNDKHPYHSVVLTNLDSIREKGIAEWSDEQEVRWSCTGCGTKLSWYDRTCRKCGNEFYNCQDEEKDLADGQS